ncbi:MAG: M23 family metallopeptidase [Myxococcaceae bacterium]
MGRPRSWLRRALRASRLAMLVATVGVVLAPAHVLAPSVLRVASRVNWELAEDLRPEELPALCELSDSPFASPPADTFDLPLILAQTRIRYVWPLASSVVTSGFGNRWDPVDDWDEQRKKHQGIDLRARKGTPVLAAADGVVAYAQRIGRGGLAIKIDHGGTIYTRYAHLSRIRVKRGQTVRAGQRIGLSGATGRVTGPHLHFEFWEDRRAQNPFRYEWRLESPAAPAGPTLFSRPAVALSHAG